MAEDKKSFILYADLITIVEKLILKDRENKTNYTGELLYHILQYVNDRDPVAIDFIVEMAFEPIKQQLKRDLKKYEKIREKRSEAGRASAEKRKQNSTNPTSVDFAQQCSTNPTVTVNDTVNVNDTVTDTVINDIRGENEFSPTPSTKKTLEERKASFQKSIEPYKDQYSSELLNEFWRYWTEIGENDKKMRFEKEKTFGVGRRLTTWKNNESKFGKRENDKGRVRHEPSRQISSYGKL